MGGNRVDHYRKELLSGKHIKDDPFEGISSVADHAMKIAECARPFRIWVPDSGYSGSGQYDPELIFFGDVHGMRGKKDFLQYHDMMRRVFIDLIGQNVLNVSRDSLLFESALRARASQDEVGVVGADTYQRSRLDENDDLVLFGFGERSMPRLDKRHVFARLFSALRHTRPYAEFLGNPSLRDKVNETYLDIQGVRIAWEKAEDDENKKKQLMESLDLYENELDKALYDITMHMKTQVVQTHTRRAAEKSRPVLTFVVHGLNHVVQIHLRGGFAEHGLDYMCLIPPK